MYFKVLIYELLINVLSISFFLLESFQVYLSKSQVVQTVFHFPLDILTATANERVHPCACASANSKDPVPNVYVVFVGVYWRANPGTSGCNQKNVSWLLICRLLILN